MRDLIVCCTLMTMVHTGLAAEQPDSMPTERDWQEISEHTRREAELKHTFYVNPRGLVLEQQYAHCKEPYLVFSPDSTKLATCGEDSHILVIDLKTGKPIQRLVGHTNDVWVVAFHPRGRILASAGVDRTVRIWDADKGHTVHTLTGHTAPIYSLAFSSDGNLLASAGWDTTVTLWDIASNKKKWTAATPKHWLRRPRDQALAFAQNGREVIYDNGHAVMFFDVATGSQSSDYIAHTDKVDNSVIALSPNGKWLAAATSAKTIKLFDTKSGTLKRTLRFHDLWIYTLAFSADSRSLLSSGFDRKLVIWNCDTGELEIGWMAGTKDEWPRRVALSPDNTWVAIAYPNTVRVWAIESK